jgi:hypothetical protein
MLRHNYIITSQRMGGWIYGSLFRLGSQAHLQAKPKQNPIER